MYYNPIFVGSIGGDKGRTKLLSVLLHKDTAGVQSIRQYATTIIESL